MTVQISRSEVLFGNHLGTSFNYIAQVFTCSCLQRIKNPNYKGKWKTPWIDNPGKQINILVLYVYSVKYSVLPCIQYGIQYCIQQLVLN